MSLLLPREEAALHKGESSFLRSSVGQLEGTGGASEPPALPTCLPAAPTGVARATPETSNGDAKEERMAKVKSTSPDTSDLGLFEFLPVSLQQKVARGEIDLDELLEIMTRPGEELCPECVERTVDPKSPLGWCRVCTQQRSTEAAWQAVAELEAQRDNNVAKKRKQRLRDELEPDRKRRPGPNSKTAEDYGRASVIGSDEVTVITYCASCGEAFRQHNPDQMRCPACEEIAARRAEARVTAG